MKNVFACLSLCLVLGVSQPLEALAGDPGKVETRATQLTKQLAQKVRLSEGQYVKVRQLNLRMLTEIQALQNQSATDPATLDKQLAELQAHYEWDLTAILGPRQMVAYSHTKSDMMAFSAR